MRKAERSAADLDVIKVTLLSEIKATMTIFPREFWEPRTKDPDCPGLSCSLVEMGCPFLRRPGQMEDENDGGN